MMSGGGEQPDRVSLTNLDQPLFDGADATKRESSEHQCGRADDLGGDGGTKISDRRTRGKTRELGPLVCCGLPVRQVGEINQNRTEHRAGHLRQNIAGHQTPFEAPDAREAQGNGRVEMGTGNATDDINGKRNGERPPRRDRDPATPISLGFGQHHVGDDAVAKQNEQGGTDEFSDVRFHAKQVGVGGLEMKAKDFSLSVPIPLHTHGVTIIWRRNRRYDQPIANPLAAR